ncbi:MAG: polyhydroxybutyrate depolymerase [Litorivivens sp.]|jgi:polyhydroxybutyrate depolymerase
MNYLESVIAVLLTLVISQASAQTTLSATFQHDGLTRDYILYLPANIQANAPLVFNLHGYTNFISSYMNYTEMDDAADANGFAVCFPQGSIDQLGITHWNSGIIGDTVDDVGFLSSLAVSLQSEHNLDPERTFSCGFSNGGMMSYHLACNAPETFKAVAAVSGSMTTGTYFNCNSGVSVPVFAIHGTFDTVVPYDGTDIPVAGWGSFYSVAAVTTFWNDHNSCVSVLEGSLANISFLDFSTVDTWTWSNCDDGNENWLYRINAGGHTWPGASPLGLTGNTNQDFEASEAIWDFFEQYQVPAGCPGDFNSDGVVDTFDTLMILAEFGCFSNCVTDMNGDDNTYTPDLLAFLSLFGLPCP